MKELAEAVGAIVGLILITFFATIGFGAWTHALVEAWEVGWNIL